MTKKEVALAKAMDARTAASTLTHHPLCMNLVLCSVARAAHHAGGETAQQGQGQGQGQGLSWAHPALCGREEGPSQVGPVGAVHGVPLARLPMRGRHVC